MSLSMYSASIPVLSRVLSNLVGILDKAALHAEARKIDPAVLLNARLFPDMFPLTRQIQIASDMAKGCAARLAGEEPPAWADSETSFADLQARLRRTLAYLDTFRAEQIDGSETREITLHLRSGPLSFQGQDYLLSFVLPNLFFHATTAYGILRHNGVELGKADFLGGR